MPQISISKALLGLLLISSVTAHSWVEQLMVIAPNGTMVGEPGFPRGNSPRGAGFNEAQMVHLIPPGRTEVLPTDNMCSQTQQNIEVNPVSPRLKASPGQAVALRYQENGHVSLPQNIAGKPQNGGTIFVYGTTDPQPNDALMSIHRVWNAAGTGGDGRGRLIATSNYDDSQCYQVNGQAISQQRQQEFPHAAVQPQGADLWCQTDILLPSDLQAGKALTLYWVWDWPTMPGTPGIPQGKQEIYTTCMDIEIHPNNGQQGVLNAQSFNFVQQDIANAAVPSQLRQLGNANAVSNPQLIPFQGQPAAGGSSGGSSKSSTMPVQQAPATSRSTPATKPTTSNANTNAADTRPTPPQQGGTGRPTVAPIPGLGQGQGQNGNRNGNGNGNGNGSSRGGQSQTGNGSSRNGDNGTRFPGSTGPGVFVPGAIPEFGTGSGTSIGGPNNQQPNNGASGGSNGQPGQQPAADPRPSTPATITADNPVPVVTVTQDTEVTVTQFVTVAAGQGRPNQSESSISSSTTAASSSTPTTSERTTTTSTTQSTILNVDFIPPSTSTTSSTTTSGTTASSTDTSTISSIDITLSSTSTPTPSSASLSRSSTTESTTTTSTSTPMVTSSATEIPTTTTSSSTTEIPTTTTIGSPIPESSSTSSSTTDSSATMTTETTTTSSSTSTKESEPSKTTTTTTTTTSSASLVTPISKPESDSSPIVVVPVNNRPRNRKRQLLAPLFPKPTPVAIVPTNSHPEAQANTSPLPVRSAAPEPSTAPCSKTHPAYQLRARAPLAGSPEAVGGC